MIPLVAAYFLKGRRLRKETTEPAVECPDGRLVSATGKRLSPLKVPGLYQLRNTSGEWLAAVNPLAPVDSLLDNSATAGSLQPVANGTPPYLLPTILAICLLIAESLFLSPAERWLFNSAPGVPRRSSCIPDANRHSQG